MISYKVKGIILVVILSLASIMMPFTVYADTITTNNIKGINTVLLSKTQNKVSTNEFWYVYEHTITLDANYVGTINLNVNLTYFNPSGSSQSYGVSTISNKNFYVNGNTIKINQMVTSDNYGNQGPFVSSSYLLNSSNVIKYDDIDSLEQIINLLTDIYASTDDIEGLSTNQLTELENIVANTSLANTYLEFISKFRQYNVMIESIPYVYTMFYRNRSRLIDVFTYYSYQYPMFDLLVDDVMLAMYMRANRYVDLIFFTNVNINDETTFMNNFTSNIEYTMDFQTLMLSDTYYYMRLIKVRIYPANTSPTEFVLTNSSRKRIIPIFCNRSDQLVNFSTDFALMFGYSNRLLDDLHIIANGTNQSNSAASDLESEASQYSDIADDVIGVEEGLTSNFENEVNKIDLNTGLNVFGGNFMTSATWVRTQFDRLTENTPYGSLVVYGLTLGFALLMLGKVFL